MTEIGIVEQVDIDDEMRDAYLDYAMSVIVARALPMFVKGSNQFTAAANTPCVIWVFGGTPPIRNLPVSSERCSANTTPMVMQLSTMPWPVWPRIFPCAI